MRHTLAVIAFTGLLAFPAATAHLSAEHGDSRGREQDRHAPQPIAEYKGLTSAEWLAIWWQEVFAIAVEDGSHPLIDGGVFDGNNGMVFLGGPVVPVGSPKAIIRATIPAGTHLFVPIITVECSEGEVGTPFYGEGEAELRACANGLLDLVSELDVSIDGRTVTNPFAYRVETPLFRYGPLTADNALHLPPGTQSDALGAGYALLLPPLGPGVHKIAVRASVPSVGPGLVVDTEAIITVKDHQGR